MGVGECGGKDGGQGEKVRGKTETEPARMSQLERKEETKNPETEMNAELKTPRANGSGTREEMEKAEE